MSQQFVFLCLHVLIIYHDTSLLVIGKSHPIFFFIPIIEILESGTYRICNLVILFYYLKKEILPWTGSRASIILPSILTCYPIHIPCKAPDPVTTSLILGPQFLSNSDAN